MKLESTSMYTIIGKFLSLDKLKKCFLLINLYKKYIAQVI